MSTRLLAEYRFPLHLEPSVEPVWALYNEGKRARWEPSRSLDWAAFEVSRYSNQVLEAAQLVWSHQVWRLFGRLTESPALLVRFCLERDRESDPKYFLSMRCTEDAKHVDAAERVARVCGGFNATPDDPLYAQAFTQSLFRDALDADQSLDAYVAAHVAWADSIDAALLRANYDAARDPLVRTLLGHMLGDRARQASFGWLYLRGRASAWNDDDRVRIGARFDWVNRHLLASGVLTPWLAANAGSRLVTNANAITCAAGLGGLDVNRARGAINVATSELRERFASIGLTLPMVSI